MTSTHDGRSDGHGPRFVGLYAQLLTRYLRIPTDALLQSLDAAGIEIDHQSEPIFIDASAVTRASPGSAREEFGSDRGVERPWGLRR